MRQLLVFYYMHHTLTFRFHITKLFSEQGVYFIGNPFKKNYILEFSYGC